MTKKLRKITLFAAFLMVLYMGYHGFVKDSSKSWKNYNEPQLAAFTSLEQDEEILEELDVSTQFSTYKPLDPAFFVKPNVFQTVAR